MKIETFINNEVKKYQKKVITNKQKGVNLDKLEKMFRQHQDNCFEFIYKQQLSYSEECRYKDMARNELQRVDDQSFGCFNDRGQCVGYNFYR